jgi:hypothetical protein
MSTPQQNLYQFMCHLHDVALDLVKSLRFHKRHPWHLHLVSLYGTMLELLGSTCILIREGVPIGVPILLRSAVEANLDFVNLAARRRYGYYMRAAELHEWIKILREAKTGQNPFLKAIAQVPNLDDVLAQYKSDLSKLKTDGFSPLSQKEKFGRADLDAVFRSVYNFLCCHSHNNIRALVSRHINISPNQTDFQVEFYAPVNLDGLLPYIDSLCAIIMSSTETIHRVLKSDATKEVQALKKELENQRERILTEQQNSPRED